MSWRSVVAQAKTLGAAVSFKDSYLTPPRLRQIAEVVRGAVDWSGCTRVSSDLNAEFLRVLRTSGCRTLELGVETLIPSAQKTLMKRQPFLLLERIIRHRPKGLVLVLNYMTGLPRTNAVEEQAALARLRDLIAGDQEIIIEENELQLVLASPMGRHPEKFGLRATGTAPWSSVVPFIRE